MKRKFYIVGRERRRARSSAAPVSQERRTGSEGYIGLPDQRVSRRHAEIYIVDDRIFIRDLASKNGTFLIEGRTLKRLTEGFVEPEHTLSFGGCKQKLANLLNDSTPERQGGKRAKQGT